MYLSQVNYQPRIMQNKSLSFCGGEKPVAKNVVNATKTVIGQGKNIIPKVVIPAGTLAAVTGVTMANEQPNGDLKLNDGLNNATKFLDSLGIKYDIDAKDGLLTVDRLPAELFNFYKSTHEDFDCNEVTHYIKKVINGDIDCSIINPKGTTIDFSNLEYVGGNVYYYHKADFYKYKDDNGMQNTKKIPYTIDMRNLKNVGGNFFCFTLNSLFDSPFKDVEGNYVYPRNLERVGGYACYDYADDAFPKLKYIGKKDSHIWVNGVFVYPEELKDDFEKRRLAMLH